MLSFKGRHFPKDLILMAVRWKLAYPLSYRNIEELMEERNANVDHSTVQKWVVHYSPQLEQSFRKRKKPVGSSWRMDETYIKVNGKWHLDEQQLRINGETYYLWRAVDEEGFELDVLLQKRRNKKAAIRFLARLLNSYPKPRVIVTDKLRSYTKPIQQMSKGTEHRSHKRLNNRAENAHQPTRRKEKCLIRFKSPASAQQVLALMGKTRNLFAIAVGRYTNSASRQRAQFQRAKEIWQSAATELLCA